jgi:hypothetical protein
VIKTQTYELTWNDAAVSVPLNEDDICLLIVEQSTFWADGEIKPRFVMNEKKNVGFCKNKTWFDIHDQPIDRVDYWLRIKDIPKMEV